MKTLARAALAPRHTNSYCGIPCTHRRVVDASMRGAYVERSAKFSRTSLKWCSLSCTA